MENRFITVLEAQSNQPMGKNANTEEIFRKEISYPAACLSVHAIGREEELKRLHERVQCEPLPLVITGVGGLGKTTFAQLYWQRHKVDYQNMVWVSASAIYSADGGYRADNAEFFIRAFTDNQQLRRNLSLEFDPQQPLVEHFREVIYHLAELPGQNLLVIDNVSEAAAVYIKDFGQLQNWRILLTSRDAIQNMAAFRLDALSLVDAAALFQKIYEAEADVSILAPIISDIGCHTLTIELLAGYAREKKLTPLDLHQLLCQKGLTNLDDYEISVPRSHKMQDIAAHLRDVFWLELTPDEQEILRYCAILPTSNVSLDSVLASEDFLCLLFDKKSTENHFKKCLRRLSRMNWLVEKEGAYRCHPVISETIKEQLRPNVVNCGVLVDQVTGLLFPDKIIYESILKCASYAPLAESIFKNIIKIERAFDETDGKIAQLALQLGELFSKSGELYKAEKYDMCAVDILGKILPQEHPDLAMSYYNLSCVYYRFGELGKAIDFMRRSSTLLEKSLPLGHSDVVDAKNGLAFLEKELRRFKQTGKK